MNLIGLIPWRYRLGLVGLCLAGSFLGGWAAQKRISDGEIAKLEAKHAYREAAYQRQAAEDAAQALAETQEWQDAVEAAEGQLDGARMEILALRGALDRLQLDAGGLRNRLATYAAASRAGGDSLAQCQVRAKTLADLAAEGAELLAEGGRLLRQASGDHDELAAEVVALINGWPRNADR